MLVNCKIQNLENSLEEQGYQTESSGFTPPKKIIDWVINNSTKKGANNND